MTPKEIEQFFVETQNERIGELDKQDGFHCAKCKNKGFYYTLEEINGRLSSPYNSCECLIARQSILHAKNSGMGDLLKYRIEHYQVNDPWQQVLKDKALMFNEQDSDSWFTMLGQSGCGKTMLCSIVTRGKLKKCKQIKYMVWSEFVEKVKRMGFESDRECFIKEYSNAEVLYIDDLFKGSLNYDTYGNLKANTTDVKYAFQIINERYNKRLVTIISSEFMIEEIRNEVDEAVAGRIKERSGSYFLQIGKNQDRNYRFKEEVIL